MTDTLLLALKFSAALGCGLMAGLFFAFSVAVMRGLARIKPAEGIAAMQAINRAILNPVFAIGFFGTAAVCAVVLISSLWRWDEPGAGSLLVGSLLYLVGALLVTMMFNVPLNNRLAAAALSDAAGANLWSEYLATWTAWNHLRTAACLVAAALLTVALYIEANGPAEPSP